MAATPVPRLQRAPGPGPAMAQRGGPAVLPDNPFQDPAALQARPGAVLDGYNPFESDAVSGGACPESGACPRTGALPAAGAVSHLSSSPAATAAVPDPFGSAAAPGTGGRAAPAEGESHRAPQLRLLRFAGTGGGAARPGGLGGHGHRREPRVCVLPPQQASAAAATAELLKRQEELNRKAEELDRRERELQNAALGGSQSEWLRGWGGTGTPRSPPRSSSPPSVRSEAQQLAPAAVLLPGEALLLPGHSRGDPC